MKSGTRKCDVLCLNVGFHNPSLLGYIDCLAIFAWDEHSKLCIIHTQPGRGERPRGERLGPSLLLRMLGEELNHAMTKCLPIDTFKKNS